MSQLGFRSFIHRISAGGIATVDRLLDLGPDGNLALAGGLEVAAIQASFDRNVALSIFMADGEVPLAAVGDIDGVPNNECLTIPATAMVAGEKIWRASEGFGDFTFGLGPVIFPRWAVMRIAVSGGTQGTADINAFLRVYGATGSKIKDISP